MNLTLSGLSSFEFDGSLGMTNFEDTEADFLVALRNKERTIKCIYAEGSCVGVVQLVAGRNAFIYIYIFPAFRRQGIGLRVLKLCEEKLHLNRSEGISSAFRIDSLNGREFAGKAGYIRSFSSAYMTYSEGKFNLQPQPVRQYCDKDYESAHELYAEAFHQMRVSVGDFPNSVVEQPSENMRKYWEKTSAERLVYIHEGAIVGYAHIHGNQIGSVCVGVQYQARGIGRSFVKHLCNKILDDNNDSVALYCVVGNGARRLYESLGFKEDYAVENVVKNML